MVKKKSAESVDALTPTNEMYEQAAFTTNEQSNVIKGEDLPKKVLAYLKRHEEVKAAYIDKLGGVFDVNTPPVFIKDAILYQNPYFKQ